MWTLPLPLKWHWCAQGAEDGGDAHLRALAVAEGVTLRPDHDRELPLDDLLDRVPGLQALFDVTVTDAGWRLGYPQAVGEAAPLNGSVCVEAASCRLAVVLMKERRGVTNVSRMDYVCLFFLFVDVVYDCLQAFTRWRFVDGVEDGWDVARFAARASFRVFA